MSVCEHINKGVDEGETVCLDCGDVIEGADFVAELNHDSETHFPTKTPYNKYNRPDKEKVSMKPIQECCTLLQMGEADKKQAENYLKQWNQRDKKWPTGDKGKLRALACIYYVIKKEKKPITLKKIAEQCQVDPGALLRIIWKFEIDVRPEDKSSKSPTIFIEKCCSTLEPEITDIQLLKNIKKRCEFLTTIAKKVLFLVDGRNPIGITGAVLLFTFESLNLKDYVKPAVQKKICDELSIKLCTVNNRKKELMEGLISKLNPYVPHEITKKNIQSEYNDLEKFLEIELQTALNEELTSDKSHIRPPAFVNSEKTRKQRKSC